MGLLKAIVGGTVGLVVGTMTCAPITGMIGGAFVAQDWEQFNDYMCKCGVLMTFEKVQDLEKNMKKRR